MAEGADGVLLSRVLEPSDPWSGESTQEERAANFQGQYDAISVTERGTCAPLRALAVFHGLRGNGPLAPAYAEFTEAEVREAGGTLKKTPSNPPWPADYSDAHRDIEGNLSAVANHFADLFQAESNRKVFVPRPTLLAEMCKLLQETPANDKFTTRVRRLLRAVFRGERALWDQLAAQYPELKEDAEVQKELRKELAASRRPPTRKPQ